MAWNPKVQHILASTSYNGISGGGGRGGEGEMGISTGKGRGVSEVDQWRATLSEERRGNGWD